MTTPMQSLQTSRLLVLYALHQIGAPIEEEAFSRIIVDGGFMSWFDYRLLVQELISLDLVHTFKRDEATYYAITPQGKSTADGLSDRLGDTLLDKLNALLVGNDSPIPLLSNASYEARGEGFCCRLSYSEEGEQTLCTYILVPDESMAMDVCRTFVANPNRTYRAILNAVFGVLEGK